VKLNIAVHKNTRKFASLTKQARSTSFLLISSVNILLDSKKRKKKPEIGDFQVSKLLFLRVQIFRCTFVCIALPNSVTALFNQIWIYDVTDVAF